MSYDAAVSASATRSLIVAVLCMVVAPLLLRGIYSVSEKRRPIAWVALFIPFAIPELLTAYVYREIALSNQLIHRNELNEAAATFLITLRLLPLAVATLSATAVPSVTRNAWRTHWLTAPQHFLSLNWIIRTVAVFRRGQINRYLPMFLLVLLVAFQEFELPSLLQRPAWTVWLFDAQVAGLSLTESVKGSLYVVAPQLVAAAAFAICFRAARQSERSVNAAPTDANLSATAAKYWQAAFLMYIAVACVILLVYPLWVLRQGLLPAINDLVFRSTRGIGLLQEIGYSLGMAVLSTAIAVFCTTAVRNQTNSALPSALSSAAIAIAFALGTCGALPAALFVSAGFTAIDERLFAEESWLSAAASSRWLMGLGQGGFRNTLMPWCFAAVVVCIPKAWLLSRLWFSTQSSAGQAGENNRSSGDTGGTSASRTGQLLGHAADHRRRLMAWELWWTHSGMNRCLAITTIAGLSYLDLTLPSVLAPPGVVAAGVRLYNLAHYGRTPDLSARTIVVVLVPVLLLGLLLLMRRWMLPWLIR